MRKTKVFRMLKAESYANILMKANPELHEIVAEKVKQHFPHGATILDLGAGEGAMSQRLVDLGYRVVSVDINELDFKARGAEFYKIDFNNSDEIKAFQAKYANSFDAVIAMEVIEHLENPWEYVRLQKKLIKSGGYLFLTTPNITSWLSRFIFFLTGRFLHFEDSALEWGHISPITPWELNVIFQREGFKEIEISGVISYPAFWLTRNVHILLAYILAPFYRLFMLNHASGDIVLAVAKKS